MAWTVLKTDDIFLADEVWAKTGFYDEKEYIVLGDVKRKVKLKNIEWSGKRR